MININIPEYSANHGIKLNWEDGFEIKVNCEEDYVTITANKAGLLSLANHLLNLAQDAVPIGAHLHFDEYNSLEDGSLDLIIEKVNDAPKQC